MSNEKYYWDRDNNLFIKKDDGTFELVSAAADMDDTVIALLSKNETLDKQCEVEKRRADMADRRLESARQELKEMALQIERLRAKWESVPWQALLWSVSGAASVYAAPAEDINTALDWIRAEAPKEATE